MKKFAFFAAVLAVAVTGCATNRFWNDMFEQDVKTLEAAKKTGVSKEVALSKDEAYKKTLEIIASEKFKIFRDRPKENYMIVIGLPKQTNTTQVGVFFEPAEGKTKVTVTSLSSTALKKADELILQKI